MVHRVNWDNCRRELSQPMASLTSCAASTLVLYLGGLARWCLRPEVLDLAATDDSIPRPYRQLWSDRPRLAGTCGSCWVLFATDAQEPTLLRPAFALPLQWVKGQTHSQHLPPALSRLASDVNRSFTESTGDAWGLRLGQELRDTDLSTLPLDCHSGWASLAAGLLVATEGGRPDPQVWASGSWRDTVGIRRVDALETKLALAMEYGARVVFVPSDQLQEAKQSAAGVEIGVLQMGEREPRRALADLALQLETPPLPPNTLEDDVGFQQSVKYYLKLPRGAQRTTQFYSSHLLPTITHRCQVQLHTDHGDWHPTHLATIVSGSPELVPLVARSLGVRYCLLMYTAAPNSRWDQTQAMRVARELLEADGIVCEESVFENGPRLVSQISNAVRRFTEHASPDSTVLDITPGNKWMTWTADHAMPSESWRVYLQNDTLTVADRRPRPGSERLICWQVENMDCHLRQIGQTTVIRRGRSP